MTSDSRYNVQTLAEAVDRDLRARGSSERAQEEKAYLKSELLHYGVSVPDTRAVVRAALRTAKLSHDEVIDLARILWAAPTSSDDSAGNAEPTGTGAGPAGHPTPVHERRAAATMVLIQSKDRLGGGDADFIGGLLREAMTWALVDPLAGDLIGPLSERDAAFDPVLERWASDEDFWIRRSALLAHLVPLRQGRGDFVFDWILPRAHRASGVTIREAVKRLSTEQREAVLAAR